MASNVPVNGERKKTGQKEQTTLRFDLQLVSNSEDGFSEYSYVQIVRDAKKQQKADTSSVLSDGPSMDDSSDHLASIARMFEEKYAPKPTKKRKRIIHDSDYIDRGYGYDLNDPFVDDSEFYEDFVPDHVDTKYGGFYINTGQLEFKRAEDVDEMDFVVRKKPRIKKQPSHQTPQAILASQKLKKAKQHAALQKGPSSSKKLFPSSAQASIKPPPPKKPRKKVTTNTAKAVPVPVASETATVSVTTTAEGLTAPSGPVASSASVGVKTEDNKPPPVLPDNLPQTVLNVVNGLTQRVAADQAGGKVTHKQREGYSQTLLDVESACKSVTMKTRNAVFEYLAHCLGLAKGTLTKRMKQLAKKKEDDALEGPLLKLKQAIELSMPRQQALYDEEVAKARTESTSSGADKSSEVDEDTIKTEDVFDDTSQLPGSQGAPSTGDQNPPVPGGQTSSSQLPGGQASEGSTPKLKRLPRKKYRWAENEEVKTLLFEVVKVKVHSEESCSRFNREKAEEVIMQFLEDKVRPLWPKGWMQKSILYKITEPVHKSYTSPIGRRAGPMVKKAIKKEPSSPQPVKKLPPTASSPVTLAPTSSTSVSSRLLGVVQGILTTTPSVGTAVITPGTKSTTSPPSIVAGSGGLKISTSKSPQTLILKTTSQAAKGKPTAQVVSTIKAPQIVTTKKKAPQKTTVHTISSLMKGVNSSQSTPGQIVLATSGSAVVTTKALQGIIQGTFSPSVAITRATTPQTVRKTVPKTTAKLPTSSTQGLNTGLKHTPTVASGIHMYPEPVKMIAQSGGAKQPPQVRPNTSPVVTFSVPGTNVSAQKSSQVSTWSPQITGNSQTNIARLLMTTIKQQAQSTIEAVAQESSNQSSSLGPVSQVPHQPKQTTSNAVVNLTPSVAVPRTPSTQKSSTDSPPPPTVISSQLTEGRLNNLITKLYQKPQPQNVPAAGISSGMSSRNNMTCSPILFASPTNSVTVTATERLLEEHSYRRSPDVGSKSLSSVSGTTPGVYGIGTGTFGSGAHKDKDGTNS